MADGAVGGDAVALLEVVGLGGQHLADLGGLEPQAEPADFLTGLGALVHAGQVAWQDLAVHDVIENVATHLDLGSFEDADPFSTTGDFTRLVDFGDGSTGAGIVTAQGTEGVALSKLVVAIQSVGLAVRKQPATSEETGELYAESSKHAAADAALRRLADLAIARFSQPARHADLPSRFFRSRKTDAGRPRTPASQ